MRKTYIYGIACFILAALIFTFAEGARRWYSSIFFVILGIVVIAGTKRGS